MRLSNRDEVSAFARQPMVRFVAFLLLPAALLALGFVGHSGPARLWYLLGAFGTFALAVAVWRFRKQRMWRSPAVVLPYAGAIAVQALGPFDFHSFYAHFVLAVLGLIGVTVFGVQSVMATGAPSLRQARHLAQRLSARTEWPADLSACRGVPEVRPLRDALFDEAGPAMPLLEDQRPQVRIAALAAMEFRKYWRLGQPDQVLKIAQTAPEPEVRCAAVLALGAVQQRFLVEALAESFRDPDPNVRRSVGEALLWDCERRWPWIRGAMHAALADVRYQFDGPLSVAGGRFSNAAVNDLITWAVESGPLGVRSTQTLAQHYNNQLAAGATKQLIGQLRDVVSSPRGSTVLRLELARLLQEYGQLTEDIVLRLIEPNTPSPLRLMAVEVMLLNFPSEQAIEVLREVAKQPNRELSLAAAVIVQRYLQVDLGLALGEPPPPLHSRQAAEVTKRVIDWAKQPVAVT